MYCPFLSFAMRTSGTHSNAYCQGTDCTLYNKGTNNCLITEYLKKKIEKED